MDRIPATSSTQLTCTRCGYTTDPAEGDTARAAEAAAVAAAEDAGWIVGLYDQLCPACITAAASAAGVTNDVTDDARIPQV